MQILKLAYHYTMLERTMWLAYSVRTPHSAWLQVVSWQTPILNFETFMKRFRKFSSIRQDAISRYLIFTIFQGKSANVLQRTGGIPSGLSWVQFGSLKPCSRPYKPTNGDNPSAVTSSSLAAPNLSTSTWHDQTCRSGWRPLLAFRDPLLST